MLLISITLPLTRVKFLDHYQRNRDWTVAIRNIPMAFRYALSSSISHASGRILRYARIIEIGLASFSPLSLSRTSRTFRSRLGVSLRGFQAPITPAAAKCDPLRVMECANYNICWIIGGRLAAPADAAARCTGYNTCICIGTHLYRTLPISNCFFFFFFL